MEMDSPDAMARQLPDGDSDSPAAKRLKPDIDHSEMLGIMSNEKAQIFWVTRDMVFLSHFLSALFDSDIGEGNEVTLDISNDIVLGAIVKYLQLNEGVKKLTPEEIEKGVHEGVMCSDGTPFKPERLEPGKNLSSLISRNEYALFKGFDRKNLLEACRASDFIGVESLLTLVCLHIVKGVYIDLKIVEDEDDDDAGQSNS